MLARQTNTIEIAESTSKRNYGIDALRIVSMIMVVMLHVLLHGGLNNTTIKGSVSYSVIWLFEVICYCAVDCYALISGYVGVFAKYNFSNLVILWLRVWFYTLLFSFVFRLLFPDEIGNGVVLFSFFPVFSNQYWYFTAYVVLFFFMPFLNAAIKYVEEKRLKLMLLLIISVFCILTPIRVFFTGEDIFGINDGYSALWLIVLYLIGGYIRKYGILKKVKTYIFLLLYFFSVVITWVYKTIIPISPNGTYDNLFTSYASITTLFSAVCLLLLFERLSLGKTMIRIIAFFSPLAFSVYLIHDNILIREYCITDRFIWIADLPIYTMVPLLIGVVIFIYLLCSTIDLIRFYIFKALKLKERLIRLENRVIARVSRK